MQILVHTEYSSLESNLSIASYIKNLCKIDQKYGCITDKNNIYGMWEFVTIARQNNIFPIVGVHICPKLKGNILSNGGFLLFLKSMEGLHSFNSIITAATNKKHFSEVYDTIANLSYKKELDNLIFISLNSNIYNILKYLSIPGKNLYFGLIEDIFVKKPFITPKLINFFENFNYENPIFVSKIFFDEYFTDELTDFLFSLRKNSLIKRKYPIYKKRKPVAEKFIDICQHYNLKDEDLFLNKINNINNPYNILSKSAKLKILKSISNAREFASLFSEIRPKTPCFPSFFENANFELKKICFEKLKEKKLDKDLQYISRLNYELNIIFKKDFSQYFLFVLDIIKFAKENNITYLGRGSAASSLVSYLLEITEVDPIKLNLYFERFLNPERKSYPDIDLDFSWKERDKVLLYILRKYPANSCMVSTTIRMNLKAAFRNAAKFCGMNFNTISRYSKLIPSFFMIKNGDKVEKLLKDLGIPQNIIRLTNNILNLPYARGVHPGGIVLSFPDILYNTPFLYAKKGVPVSHFDLNYIEDAGLIKIDILSQRALQVLQDSIKNINILYKNNFYLDFYIANNDAKTWEIIKNGNCRGCFYIESAAMINLLKDLKVSNFLDLVAASSVIRPGVSDSGMKDQYILRKNKIKKEEYELPILKEILGETSGIMIYQEDVLKVASVVGKLSLAEADLLRKAMSGKSRSKSEIRKLKEKFIEGGLSQNYPITSLEKIWFQMESFAGYAFCKAHSASYAVLSVKLAFLKAHYPQIFYASILNNFGGFYPPSCYNILAISENIKVEICKLKTAVKNTFFDGQKIIIGLVNFFFLNEQDKEILLSLSSKFQKENDFILAKFIAISNIEKQKTIKLIQIGYFAEFYNSVSFLKILCESLYLEKNRTLANLINKEKEFLSIKTYFTENILHVYYYRYKFLGCFINITPFQILQKMMEKGVLTDSEISIIKNYSHKNRIFLTENFYSLKNLKFLGWLITHRSAVTKEGKLMGFATFYDGINFLETVFFPDTYSKYYNLLKYFKLFTIFCQIEKSSSTSFIIIEIEPFLPNFFEKLKEGDYATDNKKTKRDS